MTQHISMLYTDHISQCILLCYNNKNSWILKAQNNKNWFLAHTMPPLPPSLHNILFYIVIVLSSKKTTLQTNGKRVWQKRMWQSKFLKLNLKVTRISFIHISSARTSYRFLLNHRVLRPYWMSKRHRHGNCYCTG